MRVAIVTDDLTSATDGTVAFAERGWSVHVARGLLPGRNPPMADVVSVDVGSRVVDRHEAVVRVEAAAATLANASIVVKQFDSTLRGHVAAEVLAMLRGSQRGRVIVAPAFPAAGRTTVRGYQHVHGILVHESMYAQDLLNPVRSSNVREMFALEAVHVSSRLDDDAAVTVLDSEAECDLDRIVVSCAGRRDVLLAGSTGLMRALARNLRPRSERAHANVAVSHRQLVIVGSVNSLSRSQLEMLRRTLVPVITLSAVDDPLDVARRVAATFERGNHAVALASTDGHSDARQIAELLGKSVAHLVARRAVDGMIVTGGNTMATILDQLAADSLEVHREIEPGVVWCSLAKPYQLNVVSKAGGFGSPEVFIKALRALSAKEWEGKS